MAPITACALPPGALLARYCGSGAYTDCYVTTVTARIDQARYVEAFYTTPLFKLERLLLAWFAGRPSTDSAARQLASGECSSFAAWSVEDRHSDQILLRDIQGNTRSWLMSTVDATSTSPAATTLYFGSAIVPKEEGGSIGAGFRALLGFHRLYSRALLRSAVIRLGRSSATHP